MAYRYLIQPLRNGAEKPESAGRIHNGLGVTEDADRHLRDKIMAVLFTLPGERLNRPLFGAGIDRYVFEGLNDLTLAALEFRVSEALRRDIGGEVLVDALDISSDAEAGQLRLSLSYRRREDRQPRNLEVVL